MLEDGRVGPHLGLFLHWWGGAAQGGGGPALSFPQRDSHGNVGSRLSFMLDTNTRHVQSSAPRQRKKETLAGTAFQNDPFVAQQSLATSSLPTYSEDLCNHDLCILSL